MILVHQHPLKSGLHSPSSGSTFGSQLRANPYPLLHGPLAHHTLVTGLGNDQIRRHRKLKLST